MTFQIKARLAAMLFLEYFIWGGWYVTVGTWLGQGLHFSGEQIGVVAGTTAIGAIISPFFIGMIADRLFATQKLLAALHALGAVLLFFASTQLSFGPIYILILLYAVAYMPTISLTNSLAFRQMTDPKTQFGPIRVLGTLGWIIAGTLVSRLQVEATAMPLRIAAAASLLLAIYCLTLPDTPPLGAATKFKIKNIFPDEVLSLFKERSFAIFAAASFLICIPLQFYYAFTNLYLNETGVQFAAFKMSFGQWSEMFCMLLIPWFFRRLGVKYMLVAGMSAWVVRYCLFAYGNPGPGMWMLWLGILLHGICYDFFFVTGQIYIDRKSSPAFRAAAQGTIILITYGVGMLLGSWLSGQVVDLYAHTSPDGVIFHQWRPIWLISAGCSAVVLALFLLTFSSKEADATMRGARAEEIAEGVPL
jgi:nucleoside transporter